MNKIIVGQFIPGNSLIHKLNPRLKLITNIIIIVLIFMSKTFIEEGIIFGIVLIGFFVSSLKIMQLFRMFKPIIFIFIFLLIINMFIMETNPDNPSYWSWWKLNLTKNALTQTGIIGIRIYITIIITNLLTATTKPMALTRGIEDILKPLKLVKFPVHIIAMIISIAFRFIPTLLSESQRIMKAQASRGVDFKNGGPRTKSKSIITLIIPLFVSAFAKAEDLANAMETRGYDPYAQRTRYRNYPIKFLDINVFLIIMGLISIIILCKTGVIVFPTV